MSKKIFPAILILLFTINAKAQNQRLKISLPEFLVGMLTDFNGHDNYPDCKSCLPYANHFFSSETKESKIFIDSLQSLNKTTGYDFRVENDGFINIISSEYKTLFNSYYDFRIDEGLSISIMEDGIENEYPTYFGSLIPEKFDTITKKISFLAGITISNGKLLPDGDFKLEFVNSDQSVTALLFLQQLNFPVILRTTSEPYSIPGVETIVFRPSENFSDSIRYFFK